MSYEEKASDLSDKIEAAVVKFATMDGKQGASVSKDGLYLSFNRMPGGRGWNLVCEGENVIRKPLTQCRIEIKAKAAELLQPLWDRILSMNDATLSQISKSIDAVDEFLQ